MKDESDYSDFINLGFEIVEITSASDWINLLGKKKIENKYIVLKDDLNFASSKITSKGVEFSNVILDGKNKKLSGLSSCLEKMQV